MAVEVEASRGIVKREYPYLGRHVDGSVVLFSSKTTGVCVQIGLLKEIGKYSSTWAEDNFTPLSPSESITLRNV